MKFRYKVTLINISIISIALSVLGIILIYRNFNETLSFQTNYCLGENEILQSTIEYKLIDQGILKSSNPSDMLSEVSDTTYSQFNTENTVLSIYYMNEFMYTSKEGSPRIPKSLLETLEIGKRSYITTHSDGHYYLHVASKNIFFGEALFYITTTDVTSSYSALKKQISFLIIAMLLVLFGCGIILSFLSSKLTKPLEKLNKATEKISEGDYSIDTSISSNDEIGMLAEKFNEMTLAISSKVEELNQMVKKREQFVADFTHEIKTPMTAIIGYADTMQKYDLTKEQQSGALSYIYHEGKRLESMSFKLFDLIHLKDSELIFSENDTLEIANEVRQSIEPVLSLKEISFSYEVEPAKIFCEKELIKTVLINILDNAKKASEKNSTVTLSGHNKDDFYHFEITDQGRGMSEETIAHIYDEFYMADKSRSREEGGAGLGMSIASMIIKRHDGEIKIQSELNKGTTVTIILPTNHAKENLYE